MYLKDKSKWQARNEYETRSMFLDPMLKALGWNFSSPDEVRLGLKVGSENRNLFPDYVLLLNGIEKLIVEAKAIKEDLSKEEFKQQAVQYAYNLSCSWAVLTDFEGLKIFYVDEEGETFRDIDLSNIERFNDNFEHLWLISRESFLNGTIDRKAEDEGRKKRTVSIDRDLLQSLNDWRERIYKDIKARYSKKYSDDVIEEIVQKIIDRLIFIRKIEDMQGKRVLQPLVRQEPPYLYRELKKIFEQFNHDYNSKLFGESAEDLHETDLIDLSNSALTKVIEGMYQPSGRSVEYNFSLIDADILGNIYEQYLGHILKRKKIVEGKTHRHAQGIYYTPTYIVEYIVRNTVGEILKNKRMKINQIRILDPACGSGSFLIKAYDYLLDYRKTKEGSESQTLLDFQEAVTFTRKTQIVKENIFGVDLDPKAVEIAQLNLLMKIAEFKERLPTLKSNIQVGNSLISDEGYSQRAFDWNTRFKKIVVDEGGFDVIIGNPPYIRIQTLDKKEVDYFNRNYESPQQNYDIYILFIERCFALLKEGGILGFILPHKFFQGENGEKIRKFIYNNRALHKIVDFGTNQVFEDATTYTCLLFLQKSKNKQFFYKQFKLGDDFKNLSSMTFESKDIRILEADKWNFSSGDIQSVLTKIKKQKNNFRDITKKIFKGSSTGNDEIFLLDLIKKGRDTSIAFSTILNKEIEIENELLHEFIYGEDVRRYAIADSKKVLLFPYLMLDGEARLIQIDSLKKDFPLAFGYLNKVRNELMTRKVPLDDKNFYKYSAARSLAEYAQAKIMIPDMLVSNRIGFDQKGTLYHGPAVHSIVFNEKAKGHHPNYYLGILNSKLFWFFIVNTSTALRGNAYRLTPEFLAPFSFPDVNAENKGLHDKLVTHVDRMLLLSGRLAELQDRKTDERAEIEEQIRQLDTEIDEVVYAVYGITANEKSVIEQNLE